MIVALIYGSPQQYDSAVYGSGEYRDVVVNRQRSGSRLDQVRLSGFEFDSLRYRAQGSYLLSKAPLI